MWLTVHNPRLCFKHVFDSCVWLAIHRYSAKPAVQKLLELRRRYSRLLVCHCRSRVLLSSKHVLVLNQSSG